MQSLVRDFRAGAQEFFHTGRPGPRSAPGKDAARARILELRAAGHSIDEIGHTLTEEGTPLNRTGISEVISDEGLPRLWRRPETERGGPRRATLPRAEALDLATLPAEADTRVAGLLLAIPDLLTLDLPGLARAAGYPSTAKIPRHVSRKLASAPKLASGASAARPWPSSSSASRRDRSDAAVDQVGLHRVPRGRRQRYACRPVGFADDRHPSVPAIMSKVVHSGRKEFAHCGQIVQQPFEAGAGPPTAPAGMRFGRQLGT